MTPLTTAPDIHFFITVAEKEPRILSSAPRIRQRIRQRILKSALNLRRKTPPPLPPKNPEECVLKEREIRTHAILFIPPPPSKPNRQNDPQKNLQESPEHPGPHYFPRPAPDQSIKSIKWNEINEIKLLCRGRCRPPGRRRSCRRRC